MRKTLAMALIVLGAALAIAFAGAAPATAPAAAPSSQPAKELSLDLSDKVTLKVVLIPAGKTPQWRQVRKCVASKSQGRHRVFVG